MVTVPKKSNIEGGFQLLIYLSHVHVPRMWLERHPEDNTHVSKGLDNLVT